MTVIIGVSADSPKLRSTTITDADLHSRLAVVTSLALSNNRSVSVAAIGQRQCVADSLVPCGTIRASD